MFLQKRYIAESANWSFQLKVKCVCPTSGHKAHSGKTNIFKNMTSKAATPRKHCVGLLRWWRTEKLDTKAIIRSHKSKDRQCNGHQEKHKKTQWPTKQKAEIAFDLYRFEIYVINLFSSCTWHAYFIITTLLGWELMDVQKNITNRDIHAYYCI